MHLSDLDKYFVFYNELKEEITYASAVDIVGHEYTHAVLNHKTELSNNYKEAYTIKEAYADIFGSFINNSTWMKKPRNIAIPNQTNNPTEINDLNYKIDSIDPHQNSTIISHAAFLMQDTYHIPFIKLRDLWYESLCIDYEADATFSDVRTNVISAAKNLNFTYDEISDIRKAFDTVGIEGSKGNAFIYLLDNMVPIKDANITLINYGDETYGTTDAKGKAEIIGVPTGKNTIKVEIKGYEPIYSYIMVQNFIPVPKIINVITSKSEFDWVRYDHYNYPDTYVDAIEKHIVFDENDIKMIGYSRDNCKDFLIAEDTAENDANQKVFSFKIKRDANNWHTMEGGGFLFGTKLQENGLSGYCLLVTEDGLKLYELKLDDVIAFCNGQLGDIKNVGKLLGSYDIGDVLENHEIKLRITGKKIDLWDGDKIIIEEYELPYLYGGSFGPITSHITHACEQISYFNFL